MKHFLFIHPVFLWVLLLGGLPSSALAQCKLVWQPTSLWSGFTQLPPAEKTSHEATWLKVSTQVAQPPQGVVMLMTGLNNPISIMRDLVDFFQQQKMITVEVALSGHRGNEAELATSSAESWQAEWLAAYQYSAKIAQQLHVPLYFVGFSLGALIHSVASVQYQNALTLPFARQFFFAPALVLNMLPQSLKLILWLPDSTCIPSFNLMEYQANEGTPIRFYRALFQLLAEFNEGLKSEIGLSKSAVPTTIFIHPQDELVNSAGIAQFKKNNWELVFVETKNHRHRQEIHHLIIDEASVGSQEWNHIKKTMLEKLSFK